MTEGRLCFEAVTFELLILYGCRMHNQAQHSKIPRSDRTLYVCDIYGSRNKQRLFLYTALTDWKKCFSV